MKYNKKYFEWQKNIGFFGGIYDKFKFEKFIKRGDVLLDFGSGGGYLLDNINCKEKKGIEINDTAIKEAKMRGINCVKTIEEIKDNYADVIISNHALEHVDFPLGILKKLKSKLKTNGKIIFVVPHQSPNEKYVENDVNMHLYTWNPLTLGNLFKRAGYDILRIDIIRYAWSPKFNRIYSIFGNKIFNLWCVIYAYLKNNYQIRVVAKK